jgi:hypothetical protein
MQVSIPFTGPSYSGRSSNVNAQECVNLIHNIDNSSGKAVLSMMNRPCLVDFTAFGAAPIRGMIEANGSGYVVAGDTVYKVLNDGSFVSHPLKLSTSSGTLSMAYNGFQIMIVDGVKGYIIDVAADTLVVISDVNFAGGGSVTFMDQYFFVDNTDFPGVAQSSKLADGTTWNALDKSTAENDPDKIQRTIAAAGDLWLMGSIACEPYWNQANPVGFPFSARKSSIIKMGLAAKWSAVEMNNSLYWLAQNKEGMFGVVSMGSGGISKVSTPAIDYQINTYSVISDAIAFTFTLEGHSYYVLTFPTANKTWVYDASTDMWSEWRSYGVGRFKCSFHMLLNNRHILGDSTTGKLYEIKHGVYSDSGQQVERIRSTAYVHKDGRDITVNKLWIEHESGVGIESGQGSNPMVMLQFSKDGGKMWSNEYWQPLGKMGEYKQRQIWTRLGRSPSWIFRRTATDPVKDIIIASYAQIEVANE